MEEQKKINYAEEFAKLKEVQTYWKAKEGKYKIEMLEEAVETQYNDNKGTITQQWKLNVRVNNGEAIYWTIPKSETPTSVRGQILRLVMKNNQVLKGLVFELIVIGSGVNRRYTIPAALDPMPPAIK